MKTNREVKTKVEISVKPVVTQTTQLRPVMLNLVHTVSQMDGTKEQQELIKLRRIQGETLEERYEMDSDEGDTTRTHIGKVAWADMDSNKDNDEDRNETAEQDVGETNHDEI